MLGDFLLPPFSRLGGIFAASANRSHSLWPPFAAPGNRRAVLNPHPAPLPSDTHGHRHSGTVDITAADVLNSRPLRPTKRPGRFTIGRGILHRNGAR
jgi:hypothetical protein